MKKHVFFLTLTLAMSVSVYGQTGNLSRINMLTYGGLPAIDSTFSKPKILINETYISAYDEKLRNPMWVAFRLGNFKNSLKI